MTDEDKKRQPLVLRDEIFDEIINGYKPIDQKADEQVLLKEGEESNPPTEQQKNNNVIEKYEDKPKSEVISPVIKKRIENAGKVAFNTKEGRGWLTLSFGEILSQREQQEAKQRTFFEKIQQRKEEYIESHRRYANHSVRSIFNLFLRLRAIIRVFNDLKDIVLRTKHYFDNFKPDGMTNSEFVMQLIQDDEKRKDFFGGLMDEIAEPIRNTIIDTLSFVLVPFVTLVLDVSKEILITILRECIITISKVFLKKIPFINNLAKKAQKSSISNLQKGVTNAIKNATKSIAAKSGAIVKGVVGSSKALSKGAAVVTKVASSSVVKAAGKGVAITSKGVAKAVGVTAKVVSYPIRATGRYAMKRGEAVVTDIQSKLKSGVRVIAQNPVELMAMKRMAQDGFEKIQEYANIFFGSFVIGHDDSLPQNLASIIDQVSSATIDKAIGFLGAIELHVPDTENFSYDAEKKKATITLDNVGYSSLWTQMFQGLFQGIQQQTGDYFRSISISDTPPVLETFIPQEKQYNGSRSVALTTNVKSKIFGNTDYTRVTGFHISIANGKDFVEINTENNSFIFNSVDKESYILKEIDKFLFTEQDLNQYIDEDSSISPEKSTASTVNIFQRKTINIEDSICKLCHSINDIAINVGIALNSYYKTANAE